MNAPGGLGSLAASKPVFQAHPDYGRAGPSPFALVRALTPPRGVVTAPAPRAPYGGLRALAPHPPAALMPHLGAGRAY